MRVRFGRKIGKWYVGSSAKVGDGFSIVALLLLLPLCIYYLIVWPFVTIWRWIAKKGEVCVWKKTLAIAMCAIIITSAVTAGVDLYWSSQEGVPLNAYTMRGETPPPAVHHKEPEYVDGGADNQLASAGSIAAATQPPAMVWVSAEGDKYHKSSSCSGMRMHIRSQSIVP